MSKIKVEQGVQTTPVKLSPQKKSYSSNGSEFEDEETQLNLQGEGEKSRIIKKGGKYPIGEGGKKKGKKQKLLKGAKPKSKLVRTTKQRKDASNLETQIEEGSNQESEEDEEMAGPKRAKRARKTGEKVVVKTKKKAKRSSSEGKVAAGKKKKAAKKEVKKKILPFKKGKWNPLIELLTVEKERESLENVVMNSCCVGCSNRNVMRAVFTNNEKLLENCIAARKHLSTLHDTWSPEISDNAFLYAVKTNNIKMIHAFIKENEKNGTRCKFPQYLIHYLNTGMVSNIAYGTKVRKVQMARGNRQGNNAFLEKHYNGYMFKGNWVQEILSYPSLEQATIEKILLLAPMCEQQFNTSLIFSIISGNRKVAAYLIDRIKNLTNYGFNNLHFEVLVLDGENLAEFHRASIHKKALGNDQVTPIHCACINPNSKYLQALFDIDPNVNLMDAVGRRPIHYAAACTGQAPLELLLKLGANPNDVDNQKRTPLHYAAICGRSHNIKLLLEAVPLLWKARDRNNMMAYFYACQEGHLEAIQAFIEKGTKVNLAGGPCRMTALSYAAAHNYYDICKFLIEKKANILSKDKFKRSALIMAARNGNAKICSLLLQRGALWDEPDSSGNTPLHYAAGYGWMECIEVLLKAGANLNANSSWKITPLNIAMLKNHFVKYLLNQPGIDVNCKDERGRTLLSLAIELSHDDVLDYITYLLQDKKADPNIPDIDGATPLHYLVTKQIVVEDYDEENDRELTPEEVKHSRERLTSLRKEMISLLLRNGADTTVATKDGKTLFDKCLESHNYELLDLFSSLVSFNTQPLLLFSFASLIYNPSIKHTFDFLLRNSIITL